MEKEKINIVELLKDCPRGMELDCTMYDNIVFDYIDEKSLYPIKCRAKITDVSSNSYEFTKNGQPNHYSNAKCVIFPKGKTTWEGFVPPCRFKDGDVLTYMYCNKPTIYVYRENGCCNTSYYVGYSFKNEYFYKRKTGGLSGNRTDLRLATEEEKQKLFDAIKEKGYHWNTETKTLEKLTRFKDGDVVVDKRGITIAIFKQVHSLYEEPQVDFYCGVFSKHRDFFLKTDKGQHCGKISSTRFATKKEKQILFDAIKASGFKWNAKTKTLEKLPKFFKVGDKVKRKDVNYTFIVTITKLDGNYYDYINEDGQCGVIHISTQDEWELLPNKFDITTLKLFDSRVLVRDDSCYEWEADIYGRYSDGYITLGGGKWKQCIPYEGNEHLFGTTNDCDDFYKTWEK